MQIPEVRASGIFVPIDVVPHPLPEGVGNPVKFTNSADQAAGKWFYALSVLCDLSLSPLRVLNCQGPEEHSNSLLNDIGNASRLALQPSDGIDRVLLIRVTMASKLCFSRAG